MTLANESRDTNVVEGLVITETGLPGVLFSMLDTETDGKLIKDIHDTLTSMLQILAADNLSQWLSLCKDVLTIASGKQSSPHFKATTEEIVLCNHVSLWRVESSTIEEGNAANVEDSTADNENADAEGDDDQAEFHADESAKQRLSITPRWPTRVFAAQCVRRIVAACMNNKQAHFDLALAKEMQLSKGKGETVVGRLSLLLSAPISVNSQ